MSYNTGDILFQLFYLLFLVGFVIVIVSLLRSTKMKKSQLERIEAKLDKILDEKRNM